MMAPCNDMTTATSNSEKQEVTTAVGAKRQQTMMEYSYNGAKLQGSEATQR
jgi:hypothetical protein